MNRDTRKFRAILLFLLALLGANIARASTIYVNAAGRSSAPNGTSWATAFVNLQDALNKAVAGDEIWVAQGTYVPTKIYAPHGLVGGAYEVSTPNLRTFDLPNQVAIYGGFAGTETLLIERNPALHISTLSGGGTSWHVVIAGDDVAQTGVTATLDGLTISGGNATGPDISTLTAPFTYSHDLGGGIYCIFGSILTVNNVRFISNSALSDGGAIVSLNSTLNVTNSYFSKNFSGVEGGAVEVLDTFEGNNPHTSTISTSVFDGNNATVFGGAVVGEGTFPNEKSSLTINLDQFVNNTSDEGGAMVFDSLTANVTNDLFENNLAIVNAGALSTTNVVDTIVNALFDGPTAPFTKFTTTVSNCVFNNNIAQGNQSVHDNMLGGLAAGLNFALGGGALVSYMNGHLNVMNSSFNNNIAQNGDGGAILNGLSAAQNIFGTTADAFIAQTTVTGSLFVGNQAPHGTGGAMASLPQSVFNIPQRTVADTSLTTSSSGFLLNSTSGDGGAIYLNSSTATIVGNAYSLNSATLGQSIYGINSVINGSTMSPYVSNALF